MTAGTAYIASQDQAVFTSEGCAASRTVAAMATGTSQAPSRAFARRSRIRTKTRAARMPTRKSPTRISGVR